MIADMSDEVTACHLTCCVKTCHDTMGPLDWVIGKVIQGHPQMDAINVTTNTTTQRVVTSHLKIFPTRTLANKVPLLHSLIRNSIRHKKFAY